MADRPEIDRSTTAIAELPQRQFGRNGETIPLLGLGTAPGGKGLSDDDAVRLYHHAIDVGVTYLDTAPGYGEAQRQLSRVLRQRRDEVFLVTKTPTSDRAEAVAMLERNLADLGTDSVDLALVHDLGPRDVDQVLGEDGALAGLIEAKRRGLTRYVGFSAHSHPAKARRVIESADVDAVLLAMNFADRFTYNFEERVLPAAADRGVAVVGMKAFGGAPRMTYTAPTLSALAAATDRGERDADRFRIDFHDLALRYALTLTGVSGVVVGVYTEAELRTAVRCARDLRPLSTREEQLLQQHGKRIAEHWGAHFGPVGD